MWYKVYADGSEIDIIHAISAEEAIVIAKIRHGEADDWQVKPY
jgi:hypothetical protein